MYQLYMEEKREWLEVARKMLAADPVGPELDARLKSLPEPVRRYLRMAGFESAPLPRVGEVIWKDSKIKFGPDKPWTSLKTLQFNATLLPARMAYMTTKMYGVVPFEGRDLFADGHGHMLGKIAGFIPVFDDQSKEISQSGVVTVLAVVFLVPGYLTEPYVTWETAYCENYIEKDGYRFPSAVRAAWHLPEGEFEYWNGTIDRVVYDIKE